MSSFESNGYASHDGSQDRIIGLQGRTSWSREEVSTMEFGQSTGSFKASGGWDGYFLRRS